MRPDRGPALREAHPRRRRVEGFTLIELMLAVFLIAVIMSVIYAVVVSTMKADERIGDLTHGSEIGPAILAQVIQDLNAAIPPEGKQEYFIGQDRSGKRDRLDFVSSVIVYAPDSPNAIAKFNSINEVGYQVKDSLDTPGEMTLYRKVDPFIDAEPLRGGELTVIAEHIVEFNVEYWNGTTWMPTWVSTQQENKLPKAVKVELKIKLPKTEGLAQAPEKFYSTIIPMIR